MNPLIDLDIPRFMAYVVVGAVLLSMGLHGLIDAFMNWYDNEMGENVLITGVSFGVAAVGILILGSAWGMLV
jgi:hypothetical protein